MSITVVTSAVRKELCQLHEVKVELGITGTDDDALITDIIQQASDHITVYCLGKGGQFTRQTYKETLKSDGSPRMLLTHTPVVSVSGIKFDGSTIPSTSFEIEDSEAGVLWRATGWTTTEISTSFLTIDPSGFGRKDWEVTYTAGYIVPGSTLGTQTLPHALNRAAIELSKVYVNRRYEDAYTRSQKVGDAFEWVYEREMPPRIAQLLKPYKRVDLGL